MGRYKLWKLEDLKKGIDRFYKENKRYPTVSDLDSIDYLPSSRWIQVKFGGMIKVRKDLGYKDVHLGVGQYRSKIANQVNRAGLKFEHRIEKFLINKFGEPFVHIQKRIGDKKNRIDFFVYSTTANFGVDVTSVTGHFRNLQINVNVKIAKYKDLNVDLYIVIDGNYDQNKINKWILTKVRSLPSNWKILTFENFIKMVGTFTPLLIQLQCSKSFCPRNSQKISPFS